MRRNHPLPLLNRFRSGGRCLYHAPVSSFGELREALELARRRQLPLFVLGKGCNVLPDDDDVAGIVLTLYGEFKAVTLDPDARTVTAGAGASLMGLGRSLAGRGYAGFTYLGVIPGSVGGAVRMNAGMGGAAEIKNDFLSALALNPRDGRALEVDAAAMNFGYRSSALAASPLILLRATLRLPETKEPRPGRALGELRRVFAERRALQPACPHTFGSVFKNPRGAPRPAGWYLDQAGMRGLRIGGAMVAREHANWIINVDRARSSHARELIAIGQKRVYEAFGIHLEREVVYLPGDMAAQPPHP